MSKKNKNLQPWLDYFEVLHSYEQNGLLEVLPEKHEAYVTLPALLTISGFGDANGTKGRGAGRSFRAPVAPADLPFREIWRLGKVLKSAIRSIRTYAGWKSQHGGGYLDHSFAVHVVKDKEPHDLIYTYLITSRRRWWKLWMWHDSIEVIQYS